MYTYIHTSMHACMHAYIYIHTYMHACMHACIHTYMHACIHTYIHFGCRHTVTLRGHALNSVSQGTTSVVRSYLVAIFLYHHRRA